MVNFKVEEETIYACICVSVVLKWLKRKTKKIENIENSMQHVLFACKLKLSIFS
jgi:hypothetical protein